MEQCIVEYVENKSGLPNVKINGLYIHSKYKPQEEAEQLLADNFKPHYTTVLFGYGIGYAVEEFLKISKNEHIIVIDPLIGVEKIQVQSQHLNNERVHVYHQNKGLGLTVLLGNNSTGLKTTVNFITTTYYDKLFTDYYKEILGIVRDYLVKVQVNINTIDAFSDIWQENLAKNMLHMMKDDTLFRLRRAYNFPVVIASGGPSLNKQLPYLKEIQNKVIIIAAGTTINTLLKYGIKPHYVVSIDGSETNYKSFLGLDLEGITLLYTPFNHWKIRSMFSKGFSFNASHYPSIADYLERVIEKETPLLMGGGTVAHFAFSSAVFLSIGPIAFIGQDLAFTNGVTHANHNPGKKDITQLQKENRALFEIEDYFGGTVTTDGPFLSMKTTFEEIATHYKNVANFYNCTEGGAKIKGFPQMSFKKFINDFVSDSVTLLEEDTLVIDNLYENVAAKLKEELLIIEELNEILIKGLKTLEKSKLRKHYTNKVMNELNNVDELISNLTKQIQIDFLVQPLIMKVESAFLEDMNENREEKFLRSYKQTKFLYEELMKILEKSKNNLTEVVTLLEDEEKLHEFYGQ